MCKLKYSKQDYTIDSSEFDDHVIPSTTDFQKSSMLLRDFSRYAKKVLEGLEHLPLYKKPVFCAQVYY